MTKQELDYHWELRQQLVEAKELLTSLEAASEPRAQKLDGMPHATGISDPVGNLAVEIADMRETVIRLEAEITRSAEEIATYISGIPDSLIRTIFRLRFIHGMAWKEVAATVGRWSTEEAVKSTCYRYLKNGPPHPMGRPPKSRGK